MKYLPSCFFYNLGDKNFTCIQIKGVQNVLFKPTPKSTFKTDQMQ